MNLVTIHIMALGTAMAEVVMGVHHRRMKRKETKKVTDQEWRALLTPFEYDVFRRGGTEPAFSGEYDSYYPDAGHFACKGCKAPL